MSSASLESPDPQEVWAESVSTKAVQIVASQSPGHISGPTYPGILVCGNGSGSSCLGDRFLCRHLLSVGAPRTARRPVKCRLTSRRLPVAPQSEGIQARSDPMSVDDIQKASSELDRRRRDPAFNHREVQVTVRLDTDALSVAALEYIDISSKALAGRTDILCHYLRAPQAPIVLVVVSALEEVVNEPPLIKTILHQLQLHNTSHAHTRLKAYLVLTKIDKVVEEDIQARILDRLMAGLQADSTAEGSDRGLAAEPCLAAFDGIFAVVSGHPKHKLGPELASFEASKLAGIQRVAETHAEYAPHRAALQSRLGVSALWGHVVGKMDRHSLRWLREEQVPKMQLRLADVVAEQGALPTECPSMQAVLDDVMAKVDQDAFCFTLPHLVTASIKGDDPARSRYIIKSLHRLQQCLENGAHGLQGTAAWAAKSPLVREDLMRYSTEHRVVDMAKDAVATAITQAFKLPSGAEDRLCITRFAGLQAELTDDVLSTVMDNELHEHGPYMNAVLRHLMFQWHSPNGPSKVCADLQAAMLDLARECAVRCLPQVLSPEAVRDFVLEEDVATATQRAALIRKACSLQAAIAEAHELEEQFKHPRAELQPPACPAPEPQPNADAASSGAGSHTPTVQAAVEASAAAPTSPATPSSTPDADEAAMSLTSGAEAQEPHVPEIVQQEPDAVEAMPAAEDADHVSQSSGPSEERDWQVLHV